MRIYGRFVLWSRLKTKRNSLQKKIDEISDSIVPPAEGTEDEYVFLKIMARQK
jgi:hypothetical protein